MLTEVFLMVHDSKEGKLYLSIRSKTGLLPRDEVARDVAIDWLTEHTKKEGKTLVVTVVNSHERVTPTAADPADPAAVSEADSEAEPAAVAAEVDAEDDLTTYNIAGRSARELYGLPEAQDTDQFHTGLFPVLHKTVAAAKKAKA